MFFRDRFLNEFSMVFLMENASQNGPAKLTRIHPFGSLSEIFSEDRFSDAFWLPLGSTLAPLWLPFAPLGSF